MTISNLLTYRRVATITVAAFTLVFFAAISQTFRSSAQKQEVSVDLAPEAATITGRVFQDFNSNGLYDTATGVNSIDVGVAGVTVSAYDPAGVARGTTTTAAAGTYSLAATGTGPYRIEFTTLPSGYSPSARSTDSVLGGAATDAGSTVQFVNNANTTNVNLALARGEEYCQNNPTLVISRYAQGASNGTYAANPVLYDFPYNAGTTYTDTTIANYDNPTTHALTTTQATIGTVYSLAYNSSTNRIYAASYFKKHSGFGPGADGTLNTSDDPGAIYLINPATSAVTATFTVPNATTNNHDILDYASDNNDIGWDAVGKSGLGGMDIADDNSRLFVMNMQDRRLYALNPTTGANLGSTVDLSTLTMATPAGSAANCAAGDKRPFAVSYYRSNVYVGAVCSADSTNNASDLYAYVFQVNPTTLAVTATPTFSTQINYGRGFADPGQAAEWRPWEPTIQANFAFPMPMLTDIEFENGNLILGLRDRTGDSALDAGPDGKRTAGDTIRACGTFGSWTLESNGRCGGTGSAPQGTGQGPGNGEFYHNDDFCLTPNGANYHDEVSWGSLMYLPGRQHVITTLLDPISRTIDAGATFDGGVRFLNNTTGNAERAYRIYNGLGGVGQPDFGKANGLGGMSAMCSAAPIEIGNRVWRDTDNDGVQDPGENGIAGVTMRLYQGASPVNYTTTPYADNFPGIAYNGSTGSTAWSGSPWAEISDDGNVTGGDVRVVLDGTFSNALRLNQASNGASRLISLAGASSATLTYDYRRNASQGATAEYFNGTSWVVLATYAAGTDAAYQASGSISLPVTATAIRFMNGAANGNNQRIFVDNVQITKISNAQITDANGEYYFTDLQPNTAYQVRVDDVTNFASGGPLFGLSPTLKDSTSQLGNDDASDSDAAYASNPPGSPAGVHPVISLTTGAAGTNDHTFDVGFGTLAPSASGLSLDGRVTTAEGNGIRNVVLSLTLEDGTVMIARTGAFGYYRFEEIPGGQTAVVSITAKRYTFSNPVRLVQMTDNVIGMDWVAE
ncbi:MAG: hypothetical protein KA746_01990 [Pyrinomonadaceae bacterium]|nr:hypothetical protein [Pyrinomonadaceae bacterium]MBP6211488.1 hypothetical protein [Pyrinomonadaceae bacterium]